MAHLNVIPHRVQACKKSAACCGADVAISLICVHCKDVNEEKLKSLKAVNKKNFRFEDFMKTFIKAATWIANNIDLDTFIGPPSPALGACLKYI